MNRNWTESAKTVAFACACTLQSVGSALAADVSANSSASVIAPIGISQTVELNFGTFAPTSTSGTLRVRINNNNFRLITGGVELITGGAETWGNFRITGEEFASFTLTVPAIATSVSNGSETMIMDTFQKGIPHTILGGEGGGYQNVRYGAILHVEANQAPGTYTGTFEASVLYD